MIPVSTLAERIRWILDNRPYSAQALSTRAGLAPGHVGHFLHNRVKNPRRDTIAAIAVAAGVSVWWLVDGTGSPDDAAALPPGRVITGGALQRVCPWPVPIKVCDARAVMLQRAEEAA